MMADADSFLTLLVDRIPEARPFVEEKYELGAGEAPPEKDTDTDLYANLLDLFTRAVLQPALAEERLDEDLLRRCFDLVEEMYETPGIFVQGAVYWQVLEYLLESPGYLATAIPFLKGESRDGVSSMLKDYAVKGYEHGLPLLSG